MRKFLPLLFSVLLISCGTNQTEELHSKQEELEEKVNQLNTRNQELEDKVNDLDQKTKMKESSPQSNFQESNQPATPKNEKCYVYVVISTTQYDYNKIDIPDDVTLYTGLIPKEVRTPKYIPSIKPISYVSEIYEYDKGAIIKPLELSNFELDIETKISGINLNNRQYIDYSVPKEEASILSKRKYVFDTYDEANVKHSEAIINR